MTREENGSASEAPESTLSRDAASFVKNGTMLTISSLMVSAIGFIYRIYLARYLGADTYGLYVFITTFIAYFGIISMFGFRNVIVRQVAADRKNVSQYARVGVESRLVSGIVALILSLVFIVLLPRTQEHRTLFILCAVTLPIAGITDILDAVFLGLESSQFSTVAALISNAVKIGAGIWLLVHGYDLFAVLSLFIGTTALNLLIDWLFLRFRLKTRMDSVGDASPGLRKYVFKEALPFWYITLMSKIYYKNDILVLGYLKGDRVVGWYGGAYMAIDMLLLLVNAVCSSIFPIISRTYSNEPQKAIRYYEAAAKYALMLGLPLCLCVGIFGPKLIPIILGRSFVRGMDALTILIWMVLFEIMAFLAGTMLQAIGEQRQMAKVGTVVTVTSLVITILLVQRFSYIGAAWATTLTSILNFFTSFWLVKRFLPGISLLKPLSGVIVSGLAMGLVMYLVGGLNQILGALLGFVGYGIMLFLLKSIGPGDVRKFRMVLALRK